MYTHTHIHSALQPPAGYWGTGLQGTSLSPGVGRWGNFRWAGELFKTVTTIHFECEFLILTNIYYYVQW